MVVDAMYSTRARTRQATIRRPTDGCLAQLVTAWERFAGGEESVSGVDADILSSWYRSRDVYKIDPLSGATRSHGRRQRRNCLHPDVFANLGATAAALVADNPGTAAMITDGDGWTVTCVPGLTTDPDPPECCWSESQIGTNGIGTGLVYRNLIFVRGPEHWCSLLHDWSCVAYPVRDAITREPIAAMTVFSRDVRRVLGLGQRIRGAGRRIENALQQRAKHDAVVLTEEFSAIERHHGGKLLAVDGAGNIVAANDKARQLIPGLPASFMLDPDSRRHLDLPNLQSYLAEARERSCDSPDWTGFADFGTALTGVPETFEVRAVVSSDGLAGWLLLSGHREARSAAVRPEDERAESNRRRPPAVERIAAVHADRVLLVHPAEIRYARAAGHTVWLATDWGTVRATTRGIENLAASLDAQCFVRVHRSFIVNIDRVRGVEPATAGGLLLSTDPRKNEKVPVSRANVARVKQLLGI